MAELSNKIRVLVVDDEPFARERVRRLLSNEPDVEIVGEAGDGASAISEIKKTKPDLLFLDVQMPGKNGFEVLENLQPEETPVVIFLTAFDQYAVRAFESAALDYLLKPFDEERFQKSVERARKQLERPAAEAAENFNSPKLEEARGEPFGTKDGFLERVLVKKGGRVFFFKADEIEWVEAYGNYVRLHFAAATYLLRETISNLETRLDPQKFVRVHRSGLVNLEKIRELQPVFGGRARLLLSGGAELSVSRRYNRKLSKMLERTL